MDVGARDRCAFTSAPPHWRGGALGYIGCAGSRGKGGLASQPPTAGDLSGISSQPQATTQGGIANFPRVSEMTRLRPALQGMTRRWSDRYAGVSSSG
jgi:hypothetical protein